eukprot:TRINITY_DN9470_c0_g1_i1.p1 TRINITY_DN9470_c0_g1~~TRINITY_DN9470_c0_g1_i1.p1  ORF type:complete len:152 (-),score=12.40 TRINITY_DN9470_c0_g1_i1:27-482(-)
MGASGRPQPSPNRKTRPPWGAKQSRELGGASQAALQPRLQALLRPAPLIQLRDLGGIIKVMVYVLLLSLLILFTFGTLFLLCDKKNLWPVGNFAGSIVIDHNHQNNCVRRLLCNSCNCAQSKIDQEMIDARIPPQFRSLVPSIYEVSSKKK